MSNPTQFVLKKALHFTLHKFYGRVGDVLHYTAPKTLVYRHGDLVAKFDLPQTSVNGLIKAMFLEEHVNEEVAAPEVPEAPEAPVVAAPETPEVPAEAPEAPAEIPAAVEAEVAPSPTPEELAAAAKEQILAVELPVDDEGDDNEGVDIDAEEAPVVEEAPAAPAEDTKPVNPRRAQAAKAAKTTK